MPHVFLLPNHAFAVMQHAKHEEDAFEKGTWEWHWAQLFFKGLAWGPEVAIRYLYFVYHVRFWGSRRSGGRVEMQGGNIWRIASFDLLLTVLYSSHRKALNFSGQWGSTLGKELLCRVAFGNDVWGRAWEHFLHWGSKVELNSWWGAQGCCETGGCGGRWEGTKPKQNCFQNVGQIIVFWDCFQSVSQSIALWARLGGLPR